MKLILAILTTLIISGCTAPDRATSTLTSAGFKDIEITGYNFLSCSEDDTFSTGFKALGPTGAKVEGTVCSGLFKGATIRFD